VLYSWELTNSAGLHSQGLAIDNILNICHVLGTVPSIGFILTIIAGGRYTMVTLTLQLRKLRHAEASHPSKALS
jgi:hypothetical protein